MRRLQVQMVLPVLPDPQRRRRPQGLVLPAPQVLPAFPVHQVRQDHPLHQELDHQLPPERLVHLVSRPRLHLPDPQELLPQHHQHHRGLLQYWAALQARPSQSAMTRAWWTSRIQTRGVRTCALVYECEIWKARRPDRVLCGLQ